MLQFGSWIHRSPLKRWFERRQADRWTPQLLGQWKRGSPLTIDAVGLPQEYVQALQQAASWWCRTLDATVFLAPHSVPESRCLVGPEPRNMRPATRTVRVVLATPLRSSALMTTENFVDVVGNLMSAEIRISLELASHQHLGRGLLHELGHVLGLGDRIYRGDGTEPNPELLMTAGGTGIKLTSDELRVLREQWRA